MDGAAAVAPPRRGVIAVPEPAPAAVRAAVLAALLAVGACASAPQRGAADFVPIVRAAAPAVVGVADDSGVIGSGFRAQPSMLIVTAAHVVAHPAGSLRVRSQGQDYAVRLLASDAEADLALLQLAAPAPIGSLQLSVADTAAEPGAWILVLGCPFGGGVTATAGILSAAPGAVLEPRPLQARIQLNAAVNAGNSGGPVLDQSGKVIGVANATIPGGFGLGFAIPASAVSALLKKTGQDR